MPIPPEIRASRHRVAVECALCERFGSQLQRDLGELQQVSRLTEGAVVLARTLSAIANELMKVVASAVDEQMKSDQQYLDAFAFKPSASQVSLWLRQHNALSARLSRIRSSLLHMSKHIRYVASSTRDSVAEELFIQVRTLLERLTPDIQLVLRKQHSFGLKYIDLLSALRGDTILLNQDRELVNRVATQSVIVLSYPRMFQHDYLHLTLLAHEVGHHLWSTRHFQESSSHFAAAGCADWLTREGGYNGKYAAWRRWVEEAAADIYATLMVGPAYLFALDSFFDSAGVLSDRVDGLEDTLSIASDTGRGAAYPTRRLRLLAVFRTLEALGIPGQLEERAKSPHLETRQFFSRAVAELERIKLAIKPESAFEPLKTGVGSILSPRGELRGDAYDTACALNRLFSMHLDELIAHCRDVITKGAQYRSHEFSLDHLSSEAEAGVLRRLKRHHPFGEYSPTPDNVFADLKPVPHQLVLTYAWAAFLRDVSLTAELKFCEVQKPDDVSRTMAKMNRVVALVEQTVITSATQIEFQRPLN